MLINYQGRQIDVDEVEVLTETERWNEYQLSDGKVLSVKTVLVKVARANSEVDKDGNKLYVVNTQQIVKVK